MHTEWQWMCDMEQLAFDMEHELAQNFTQGHHGEPNHRWDLVGHEIYKSPDGQYDAVALLYYKPANPDYLVRYSQEQLFLTR
ncbi:hypothetical protein [Nostoc piscinale]|nr:hypothetical protein [Nostoc piscinale]